MQEYRITMLGPTGVGKTSLLTSMYYVFENVKLGIERNLYLAPEEETSEIINRQLEKLQNLHQNFEATGGIEGTAESREFLFDLGLTRKDPELKLIFRDYPGGYLNKIKGANDFINYLQTSHVIIVAIDAAALIEKSAEDKVSFNNQINQPDRIKDFFENAFEDEKMFKDKKLSHPKLIIFLPVKCEKYLQENRHAELDEAIINEYQASLNYFQQGLLNDKLAVVITPVQTVGNVYFSHIDIDDKGLPHFQFSIDEHAVYSPQDVHQPLIYILGFLLKQHVERNSWWFNSMTEFKEAVKVLSSKGKFEILQGGHLLSEE